jgi:uncharacterized protein
MPVKKNQESFADIKSADNKECGCGGACKCGMLKKGWCHEHHGRNILMVLFGILLVYLIVFLGTLVRNNLKSHYYIGQAEKSERYITLDAQGKVTAVPDIAVTTMGMEARGKTIEEAQKINTEVMNKLVAKLKELNIDQKDIQTANYIVSPEYNYPLNKPRELIGYIVKQSVTVKIRDLEKASNVLSLASEVGANDVSGLQFTIDDPEVYKSAAREQALQKIYVKAVELSKKLGVRITDVMTYNESSNDLYSAYKYYGAMSYDAGAGAAAVPAPAVEPGSEDVTLNVNITFGIK